MKRFEVIVTTSSSLKVRSEVISIEASVSDPTTAESEISDAVKLAISAVNSRVLSYRIVSPEASENTLRSNY